jgi:hypothetical protein
MTVDQTSNKENAGGHTFDIPESSETTHKDPWNTLDSIFTNHHKNINLESLEYKKQTRRVSRGVSMLATALRPLAL